MSNELTITPAVIAKKREEMHAHDEAIRDHQNKKQKLWEWVKAAEYLLGVQQDDSIIEEAGKLSLATIKPALPVAFDGGDPVNSLDLTKAVEKVAVTAERPISKTDARAILRKQGFSEERLGNYFYTAVARLKAKGRITVLADGKLFRPQTNEAPADTSPEELRLTPFSESEPRQPGNPLANGRQAGKVGGT